MDHSQSKKTLGELGINANDTWIKKLWEWADRHSIPDRSIIDDAFIPRDKKKLLNAFTLNLSNLGLTEVPKEIGNLNNLIELNLGGNELFDLPNEICNLTNLQYLYLHSNNLTKIPKEIGNLNNLIELNLGGNQLEHLPNEVCSLVKLRYLMLFENKLTSIPTNIGQLVNLKMLHLEGNRLIDLPQEIGSLIELVKLNLHDNQLVSCPEEIGNLVNLKELHLGNNYIENLPKTINKLMKLETPLGVTCIGGNWMQRLWAWAEKNNIDNYHIPRNKEDLIKLEKIDLSGKKLFHISEEIGNLSDLKELNVSFNYLAKLPVNIGNLSNLEKLNASHNHLIELPEWIGNLKNLRKLDMGSNRIERISKKIGNLTNLTHLYLYSNKLTELPREIINMTSLVCLDIKTNNDLKYIPSEILKHISPEGYRSRITRFLEVVFIVGVLIFMVVFLSFVFAFLSTLYQTGDIQVTIYFKNTMVAFVHIFSSFAVFSLLLVLYEINDKKGRRQRQRIDTFSATSINDLKDALKEYDNKYFINRFADFLGSFRLFSSSILVVSILLYVVLIFYTGAYELDFAPFAWLLSLILAATFIIEISLNHICYVITGNQLREPKEIREFLKKIINHIETGYRSDARKY